MCTVEKACMVSKSEGRQCWHIEKRWHHKFCLHCLLLSGEFDEWKRNRLLGVGADIVIPDYRDAELLLNVVEGK